MKTAFAILASFLMVACASPTTADDQGSGSTEPESEYGLRWETSDTLRLDARVLVPNGCYQPGGKAEPGTPDGLPVVQNGLAVMIPLAKEGEMCTMALKHIGFDAVFENVSPDAATVIVYELWPEGEAVRARALALPQRP